MGNKLQEYGNLQLQWETTTKMKTTTKSALISEVFGLIDAEDKVILFLRCRYAMPN